MADHDSESQYRWDPLLKEWVIYAPKRNKRPFQGKEFDEEKEEKEEKKPEKTWTCPFCPDAPEGAGEWIVKLLPNKFAALSEEQFPFEPQTSVAYSKKASNAGKCNVVLYSQNHEASFGTLDHSNIVALIDLWADTYQNIQKNEGMKYIFMMENRGAEIACSMSHPHGQIYSFPIIPKKIERKFKAFKEGGEGECVMCNIVKEELKEKERIIDENGSFISEIPYFAHWPFEVHIMPKSHVSSIDELNEKQRNDLAKIMKSTVNMYDKLWEQEEEGESPFMPYVMSMFNGPVNTKNREKWHFHIEYYTPFRGPGKWKYLAGVELGTHTFLSDNLPGANAQYMRSLKD